MEEEAIRKSLNGKRQLSLEDIENFFTVEYLIQVAQKNNQILDLMSQGINIYTTFDEFEKALSHYCARRVIPDLWNFATPLLRNYIGENDRFNLDRALAESNQSLSGDYQEDIGIGKEILVNILNRIYEIWGEGLINRRRGDLETDPIPLLQYVYLTSSQVRFGGMDIPDPIDNTWLSVNHEPFYSLSEFKGIPGQKLDQIINKLLKEQRKQAFKLAISSSAIEEVVRRHGNNAYEFDPEKMEIYLREGLSEEIASVEESFKPSYPDQTQLLMMCPIIHVESDLYGKKSNMLNDQSIFKASFFKEIYFRDCT